MRSFVADGNFKACHLKQKHDHLDVWLTNGEGFMTQEDRYMRHLTLATESSQVNADPDTAVYGMRLIQYIESDMPSAQSATEWRYPS